MYLKKCLQQNLGKIPTFKFVICLSILYLNKSIVQQDKMLIKKNTALVALMLLRTFIFSLPFTVWNYRWSFHSWSWFWETSFTPISSLFSRALLGSMDSDCRKGGHVRKHERHRKQMSSANWRPFSDKQVIFLGTLSRFNCIGVIRDCMEVILHPLPLEAIIDFLIRENISLHSRTWL